MKVLECKLEQFMCGATYDTPTVQLCVQPELGQFDMAFSCLLF